MILLKSLHVPRVTHLCMTSGLRERRLDVKLKASGILVTCALLVNYMLMRKKKHGGAMNVQTLQSKRVLMMVFAVFATTSTS